MSIVKIRKFNEVFLQIESELDVYQELSEHFCYEFEGARFTPKFKAGIWDGKLRMFNLKTRQIYAGLLERILEYCKAGGHTVELVDNAAFGLPGQQDSILPEDLVEYSKELNLHVKGEPIALRDYQLNAIYKALKNKRQVILSPTGSGKSAIIYVLSRYLTEYLTENAGRVLIIVPTTQLVTQMIGDFADYASAIEWDAEANCHEIMGGREKNSNKPIVVSTWQSISKLGSAFFNNFDAVLCDECIHPNTIIKTFRGDIPIIDVTTDDLVMTLNEITGAFEYKPIIKVHKNISKKEKKYKITFTDGTTIIGTGNHKMLTSDGWKRIDQIVSGSELKTINI